MDYFPKKLYFVISSCGPGGKRVNIYGRKPESDKNGYVDDPWADWLGYKDVISDSINAEIGDVIEIILPEDFFKKNK